MEEDEDVFLRRELANSFSEEKSLINHLVRRKLDAEEVREIEKKTASRRKKAYDNYEDACKIKGKFTQRSCIKLSECYAKNKLTFVPLKNETLTTIAPEKPQATTPTTTTKKKSIFDKSKRLKKFILEIKDLNFCSWQRTN